MSFGYRSGTIPVATNSRWVLWVKVAKAFGATVIGTEPKRRLREKTLKAING